MRCIHQLMECYLIKSQTLLIQYPIGKSASSYNIPDGVEEIGVWAFYEAMNLKSVYIPYGVETINDLHLI